MNHVKLFEQFVNEALSPMEFEAAVKNLAHSMPNHTKYDTDGLPSDEQIMKAMQEYQKDLYKHSTSAQKKEAVEMVKQILSESLDEAYDGKISDFKYDLEMALEEIGFSPKAIKKVSKVGKKFEVRMSSYMSQRATWEKIGELMGATLVDFKADPKSINVGLYESIEIDEMTKFKAGQKIKWSSPKGPKEDEIEKVDGIYLKLKSGGTIPYQSVITEGVQYTTYATPKGTMGRYRLQSDEVNVVKALNLSGFKYGRAFGDEVGFETASDRNQFIKILDKMHKEGKLSESVVNEAKTSLDDMMKWIENTMKFVRTSEEFNGDDGGIWVSGENGDRYKGKRIYDYYSEDPKNYELGVLKDWEKELNKRGWYSEWYDAGTVMIWPL